MLLPQEVSAACQALHESGSSIYLAGVTARELLLRREPSLFDILTDADLVSLARLDEKIEFPGRPYCDARLAIEKGEIRFRLFKRPYGGVDFDTLRRISGEELVTVNTFLYEYAASRFMDPYDAYQHLRSKVLWPLPRLCDIFSAHPSRIFDLLYLHSHDGFSLSEELVVLLGKCTFRKDSLAPEEVRDGLGAILTARTPYPALALLDGLTILTQLIPELLPTQDVPQDKDHHPEGNVYEHTLECFKHVSRPSLPLGLALLFHDIGKPETAVFHKNLSFPRHAQAGSRIARKILRRYRYDEKTIGQVAFLIDHHLVAHELRNRNEIDRKALMNSPLFPDLMKLYRADIQSCFGDMGEFHRVHSLYKKMVKNEKAW